MDGKDVDRFTVLKRQQSEARPVCCAEGQRELAVRRKRHRPSRAEAHRGTTTEAVDIRQILGARPDPAFVEQHQAAVGGNVRDAGPVEPGQIARRRFAGDRRRHFQKLRFASGQHPAIRRDVAKRHRARDLRDRSEHASDADGPQGLGATVPRRGEPDFAG